MRSRSEEHVSRVVSTMAADLVGHLRAADPAGHWQFHRPGCGTGPELTLSFHSTAEVLRELERRLRSDTAAYNWPMITDRYVPPTDKYGTRQNLRVADRLATESSEFALSLLQDGELSAAEQRRLATLHLWHLSGLTAPGDRAAFLFHFWQFGTDRMDPAGRMELATEADTYAGALIDRPLDGDEALWERYVPAVRTVVEDPQEGVVPVNYLLYDHVRLTHDRLGIPVQTGALAARALRSALSAGAPVSGGGGVRALQSV
ncbi:lantibiotic dehydratase C-terminal domain-containing protein [Streptomyces yangpuensis]|uniref:lantibiotic dehydratase C-terminal domain-containing protein n=1 Tax=Streptomyces yangpuensis TaxID=1648182 RepID=UPI0037FD2370